MSPVPRSLCQTDTVTSARMSAVRRRGTKPEMTVRNLDRALGFPHHCNSPEPPTVRVDAPPNLCATDPGWLTPDVD